MTVDNRTSAPKASSSIFTRQLVLAVLLINLFVIALVGLALRGSRLQSEQRAAVSTQNLSHVLDQYIADAIDKIDLALFAVADEVARQRASGGIDRKAMNSYISRIFSRMPFLNAIRMANAQGEIVCGADKEAITAGHGTSVADHDYFKRLRNDPNAGLVISNPIIARVTGKWVIIFARRINKPDGPFDGIIWAAIELEHFNKTFSRLDVGRNGVVALRDSEMGLIVRYPKLKGIGSSVGQKKVSKELLDQVKAGKPSGTYYTPAATDNIARTVSYRKIGNYPLYIIVGLATSEYLAEWRNEAVKMSGLTALFALITVFSSWLLYRDFTKRRQTERDLHLAQFSLKRASIGILRINPDAKILSVNDQVCKNLGYTREELCNMTILDINPTFSPERWAKHVKNFLGVPAAKTFETIHRRKDGTTFPVEVTVNYLEFQGTEFFIVFVRDLTEHKQAEEDREKLQAQLHQAQKMEAVGQLAGGVAHDFNNMLQAIIGYGSLLKQKIGGDRSLSNYIDPILSSAEKSANLTRQLLAFSRKQLIEMKPVDINDLIVNIGKLIQRLIGEDIELRIRTTDKALIVMADRGQVEQVLMNLSTNARDAMPGGGLLSIETVQYSIDETYARDRMFDKPGKYALITVSDTGTGMDEKTKGKIFEPFFTTKEMGRGTGLGLSIVYGIIKQHGGEIHPYSEPGKGTTFKIYLPLAQKESKETVEVELSLPKRGSETILLAEDSADVREVIKITLECAGYKVVEAVDGEDAINRFVENKEKVDLVITDVIMPRKSGKEVYDEIKKIKPLIKVLFTSGYTADMIGRKGITEEGAAFISKPANPYDFLIKVREILDKK